MRKRTKITISYMDRETWDVVADEEGLASWRMDQHGFSYTTKLDDETNTTAFIPYTAVRRVTIETIDPNYEDKPEVPEIGLAIR